MSDPMKERWSQVADGFAGLGDAVKQRYKAGDDETNQATSDATDAMRGAFDRLVAAGRDIGQRAVDALRDDDVRDRAREAATSLNDAISATVDLIGDQVGGLFKRSTRPDAAATVDGTVEATTGRRRADR